MQIVNNVKKFHKIIKLIFLAERAAALLSFFFSKIFHSFPRLLVVHNVDPIVA